MELNASNERGIDVVRNKVKMFAQQKVTLPRGRHKIIVLDEADRYSTSLFADVLFIIGDLPLTFALIYFTHYFITRNLPLDLLLYTLLFTLLSLQELHFYL